MDIAVFISSSRRCKQTITTFRDCAGCGQAFRGRAKFCPRDLPLGIQAGGMQAGGPYLTKGQSPANRQKGKNNYDWTNVKRQIVTNRQTVTSLLCVSPGVVIVCKGVAPNTFANNGGPPPLLVRDVLLPSAGNFCLRFLDEAVVDSE